MNAEQEKLLESLYLEMYDKLLSYAIANERSYALAEEAVQETFRIACQEVDKLSASPNPRGWLVNTLRNTMCNLKRGREYIQKVVDLYVFDQTGGQAFTEDAVALNVLYENVADTEEFQLLVEMAVEGRSHKEMADSRNITVNTCKKRVERAKKILRKKLKFLVTG